MCEGVGEYCYLSIDAKGSLERLFNSVSPGQGKGGGQGTEEADCAV